MIITQKYVGEGVPHSESCCPMGVVGIFCPCTTAELGSRRLIVEILNHTKLDKYPDTRTHTNTQARAV